MDISPSSLIAAVTLAVFMGISIKLCLWSTREEVHGKRQALEWLGAGLFAGSVFGFYLLITASLGI